MSPLGLILSCFPTLILCLSTVAFIYLCAHPSIFSLASLLLVVYGLPPLMYHLHHQFYPVEEGISYLRSKDYSAWWGTHQIQVIYIAVPVLEALLRLVPGLFSLWLRLWGAKIGQNVYWTPGLEIADRGLLEVGDRVVFGHRTGLYAHVIKPSKNNLMLYVKKISIGSDVFIGAGAVLGPGAKIEQCVYIPAKSQLYPNQNVRSCDGSFKASDNCLPPLPNVSTER